jgi:hypothetical protein
MSADAPIERFVTPDYQFSPAQVEAAFCEREVQHWGQSARFKVVNLDALVITSGVVVPCDPLFGSMAALQRRIPAGTYPISLALVRMPSGDERIAFARLLLSSAPVVTWETAWHEPIYQNVDGRLVRREYSFYYSDAGHSGFMDAAAIPAIRQLDFEDYLDRLEEQCDGNSRNTWSWCSFKPDPARPENIVCFTTEAGGRHSTFGLDAEGQPAMLVTDCRLLY